jgi:hypothetical protein
LAGVGGEIGGDFGGEDVAEFGAFLFAEAWNAAHRVQGSWILAGHGAEGVVAENDVGGNAALVGEFLAERAEALEENFVAGDVALAADDAFGFWQIHRLRERDGRAFDEDFEAFAGELKRGVFAFGDGDVAEAHELAADEGPLRAGEFAADAVGGEAIVAPAADLVGVGAGEDFDDVIQADVELGVLRDAVDAGEEFWATRVPS